jgi:hypothetical protein
MAIVLVPRPRRPQSDGPRHRAPGPASTPSVRSVRASVEPAVTAAVLSLAVGVATVPLPRLTT